MESVYLLIPLSIVLIGIGVWAFFWAVDRGQFEDLAQGERLALEEDAAQTETADRAIAVAVAPATADAVTAAASAPRGPRS
jgi:cbb3-type cytochrome oxidase maturation protein